MSIVYNYPQPHKTMYGGTCNNPYDYIQGTKFSILCSFVNTSQSYYCCHYSQFCAIATYIYIYIYIYIIIYFVCFSITILHFPLYIHYQKTLQMLCTDAYGKKKLHVFDMEPWCILMQVSEDITEPLISVSLEQVSKIMVSTSFSALVSAFSFYMLSQEHYTQQDSILVSILVDNY